MVAKANSSTLSTGLWNAIDTDAVDTDRSQAGTLPQLLAVRSAGSWKGPTGCEQRSTCCTLPVIAILHTLRGPSYISSSPEWKPTGPRKMLFVMTWAQNWSEWRKHDGAVLTIFIPMHIFPPRRPNSSLCFSFLMMYFSWKISVSSTVRLWCDEKANKRRIKYHTNTPVLLLVVEQVLFRPNSFTEAFRFLTTLRKI